MSKHVLVLFAILAATVAMAQERSGNWVEVHSPHFTVLTDASAKQGRRVAIQFEHMRGLFQDIYPQVDSDQESAVIVLAIKAQNVFRTLQPGIYLSKGTLELRGWFLRDSGKSYILMRLDGKGGDPFPVAFHEYTHLLLDQATHSVPLWLDEGLAEFYANTKVHNQNILLGEPNQHYLALLRKEKWLPLTTLFAIDENSPDYIDKKTGSVFYAESWAITHYLTLKDYEERTSRLELYTKLVREKVDPVTAGSRAFGDLKKMEKLLRSYVEQQSFDHLEKRNLVKVDDSEFEVESIEAIEAEAVQADFLACSGRFEEARALVDHILKQDPDNVPAKSTAALLESAEAAKRERELRKAIQLDPASATAYNQLAEFLWSRGRSLEEAKRFASTAVSLDANNVGYRINLSNILLSMGEAGSAIETLRAAAMVAKTPEEGAAVDQRLKDALAYASSLVAEEKISQEKTTNSGNETKEPAHSNNRGFVPGGPHRSVVGVLKIVRCDPPTIDLTVTSPPHTVALHSENYYQIQFTSLFTLTRDLKPCSDLENRSAKVDYVESADDNHTPHITAIELHK